MVSKRYKDTNYLAINIRKRKKEQEIAVVQQMQCGEVRLNLFFEALLLQVENEGGGGASCPELRFASFLLHGVIQIKVLRTCYLPNRIQTQ
jgi:hypothetical protein